jgi:hypothetical protein
MSVKGRNLLLHDKMYSKEIFKTNKGYGYKILKDGVVVIIQDFKPEVEGWVPMTQQEANQLADEEIQRLVALENNQQEINQQA